MFSRGNARKALFFCILALFAVSSQVISCSGNSTGTSQISLSASNDAQGASSQQISIDWPAGYTYSPSTGDLYGPSSSTYLELPSYVTEIKLIISGDSAATQVLDVNKETLKVNFNITPGQWVFTLEVLTNIDRSFTQSIDVTCVIDPSLSSSSGPTCVSGTKFNLYFDLDVNAPPEIEELQVSEIQITIEEQITLGAMASDLDNDDLSFNWDGGGGAIGGSGKSVTWSATDSGNYTICTKVADGNGGDTIACVVVLVIGASALPASNPPYITDIFVDDLIVEENVTTKATCLATDLDGDPLSYNWSGPFGWRDSGSTVSYTPTTPGKHILTCTVSDGLGGSDSADVSLATTEINAAPVITYITLSPSSLLVGETTTATCNAADANGDPITYSWTGPLGWTATGAIVSYTPTTMGDHILTCTAVDSNGGLDSAVASLSATIPVPPPNNSPKITSVTVEKTTIEENKTTTATCVATDPDSDPLTYSWNGPSGWSDTGSTVSYTPASPGDHSLTCTVTDGNGGLDSGVVSIKVTEINVPPVITLITVSDSSPTIGDIITAYCEAADENSGDTLSYSWSDLNGWTDTGSSVSYTATSAGEHTLTCIVTDGHDGSDNADIAVTAVEANVAPVITLVEVNRSPAEEATRITGITEEVNNSVTATCEAFDEDNDELTYSWSDSNGWTATGDIVIYTAETTTGMKTLTCTVSDGRGGTDSKSVEWSFCDFIEYRQSVSGVSFGDYTLRNYCDD